MAYTILIASTKGGVGKTITTISLASALKKLNKDVAVVDGNIDTPHIALYFGVPFLPMNLNEALKNKNIRESIYIHEGIKIIPASLIESIKQDNNIDFKNFKDIIKELKKLTDFIIIDSPPNLRGLSQLIETCDELLVIANPEMLSLTEAMKTIRLGKKFAKKISIIITRTKKQRKTKKNTKNRTEISINDIESMFDKKVIAEIPEDDAIKEAVFKKSVVTNIKPKAKSSLAYQKLAKIILKNIKFSTEIKKEKISDIDNTTLEVLFKDLLK